MDRRSKGKASQYVGDRGAWGPGVTNKSHYVTIRDKYMKVIFKDKQYCWQRGHGKVIFTPVSPTE